MSKRTRAPKRLVSSGTTQGQLIPTTTQAANNLLISAESRQTLVRIVGNMSIRTSSHVVTIVAIVMVKENTNAEILDVTLTSTDAYPLRPEDVLWIGKFSSVDAWSNLIVDVKGMRKLRKNDVIQIIARTPAGTGSVQYAFKTFCKLS